MSFRDNQLFVGLVGAMLTGSVLYFLKAIPTQLFYALIDAITVEVTVESGDDAFAWIAEWLARHSYAQRARRLTLGASRLDEDRWSLSPGFGKHLLWFRGRPVLVKRETKEKQPGELRSRQVITIASLGRNQAFLRALIGEADGLRTRRDRLEAKIWCDGWWQPLPKRDKRSIDTVVLPPAMKESMIHHARWFFGASSWYAARGIPFRLGWLFKGNPGTGKTSMVMALAAYFDRPIYCLNISTISDDNALMRAFIAADKDAVLLLEDIDAMSVTAGRAPAIAAPPSPGAKAEERSGVTLSGLLNAIDGVGSPDGRLLIMTTNHAEKLDPALIRPGRVDQVYDFGAELAPDQVREMARRFFPDSELVIERAAHAAEIGHVKYTAAEWQRHFLQLERGETPSNAALMRA